MVGNKNKHFEIPGPALIINCGEQTEVFVKLAAPSKTSDFVAETTFFTAGTEAGKKRRSVT